MLSIGGSFSSSSPCAANLPFTPINSTLARSDYIMANPIARRLFIRYVLEGSNSWSHILFKSAQKPQLATFVTASRLFLSSSSKYSAKNSPNNTNNNNDELYLHNYSIPNFNNLGNTKKQEELQSHMQHDVMLKLISEVTILATKQQITTPNSNNSIASPPRANSRQASFVAKKNPFEEIIPPKPFLSIILAILLPWFFQSKEYLQMVESGWTNDVETISFASSTFSSIHSLKIPKKDEKNSPAQQVKEVIFQTIQKTTSADLENILLDKEWIYSISDLLEAIPFSLGIASTGKNTGVSKTSSIDSPVKSRSVSVDEQFGDRKENEETCQSVYLYTNRALEQSTKYPKYELINQSVLVFDPSHNAAQNGTTNASNGGTLAPQMNGTQRSKFMQALNDGKATKVGLLSTRKNKELFMSLTMVQPVVDTKGIYKHSILLSYDILQHAQQQQKTPEKITEEIEKIEKLCLLLSQIIY
jgi:hypothetical protein